MLFVSSIVTTSRLPISGMGVGGKDHNVEKPVLSFVRPTKNSVALLWRSNQLKNNSSNSTIPNKLCEKNEHSLSIQYKILLAIVADSKYNQPKYAVI